jgi:hypothetical protein
LDKFLEKGEILDMCIYFILMQMFFEMPSNAFDIFGYLFDKEFAVILLVVIIPVEFDNVCIVEVADLLKAGLVDVSFDVFVHFDKFLQFY